MECSCNEFPYQPLPENTSAIRVLTLLPGAYQEPIQCVLKHADFEESLEYVALSYVWGNSSIKEPISLGYESREPYETLRHFEVTKNLAAALRNIRKEASKQILWVDAICINQKNVQERNVQVQKMGHIYSAASKVIIWLGNFVEEEEAAIGVLPGHMQSAWRFLRKMAPQPPSECNVLLDHQYGDSKNSTGLEEGPLTALAAMCERSWFRRIWVLQEHMLASATVTIRASREEMPFEDFLEVIFQVYLVVTEILPSRASHFIPAIRHLVYRQNYRKPEFLEMPVGERILRTLIDTCGSLEATDPRDRYYGLLGIIGAIHGAPSPDYGEPLDSFYLNLAHFLIESTHTLAVLQCVGGKNRPSWAPTWEQPSIREIGSSHRIREYAQFSFSKCKRKLHTRAILLGRINSFHPFRMNISSDPAGWRETMIRLEQSLNALSGALSALSNLQEASDALLDVILPEPMDKMSDEKEDNKERYLIFMGRSDWPGKLQKPKRERADDLNYFIEVIQGMYKSGLGILVLSTGTVGRLLGDLGDDGTYEADSVYVFPGCQAPLLLTSSNGDYTIHGRCFVHGYLSHTEEQHLNILQQGDWHHITII